MQNTGTWLQGPQRFSARIQFDDAGIPEKVRVGSQATVMARTQYAEWLTPLWALYIRAIAWLSYVY
jgi:hypothetical protein